MGLAPLGAKNTCVILLLWDACCFVYSGDIHYTIMYTYKEKLNKTVYTTFYYERWLGIVSFKLKTIY